MVPLPDYVNPENLPAEACPHIRSERQRAFFDTGELAPPVHIAYWCQLRTISLGNPGDGRVEKCLARGSGRCWREEEA